MLPRKEPSENIPTLSIAVPNRNQVSGLKIQEVYLRRFALEHGIEILVSDNHSDDGSAQYLRDNWNDFAKVSILTENVGIVGNLRTLAENSKGTWIWFLGSGDLPSERVIPDLLNLLAGTSLEISTLIDQGAYECVFPFLGGNVYRRSKLIEIIGNASNEIWPHVSWSLAIEGSGEAATTAKTSLIHLEPWTSSEDWHAVKSMFPFALALHSLLAEAAAKSPGNQRIISDFCLTQKTLLTWYIQDRMSGKVRGLNKSLFQALRWSGKPYKFLTLRSTAIGISFLPLHWVRFVRQSKWPISQATKKRDKYVSP